MRDQRSHATAAPPSLEAVKVTSLPAPGSANVAYMVLSPPSKASGDKRAERRWRTHLRSGKIVAGGARIVTESQVRDRSARGVRLKLAANILLPKRIRFFDDVGKRMYEGVVAWQRGRDIGISLRQEVDTRELTRAELFKLGIKLKN
ncbi:hypothetical protein [Methylovirgula sp. HY1]|uniref:hypothetical protein n=1 Tax=Methylovirgula sp. HY1 TaxID=2822761 RepID=UPI001C5AB0D5|nr:hypothetical protein [Methylovirgula sp. HY1]QXX74684.1 hypothetical protein MHY1_01500 [Methylovirgula sp. HY1]